MQIKEYYSERINEKYYRIKHDSGLDIIVYPKSGYTSAFAIFGTKYGSINRTFSVNGEEAVTVPDGIAHYLEHKLFESEDGDAFSRFAETGANANAFTSFDKTCYLFSCSDKLEENLDILLDFVQTPYFTEQTVQKEQGIIGQEIKMYDDSPSWRVMFNMLEAMYFNHPIKIDIAGTVESISHITADLLYKCYNTFYNLGNMVLCVVGNVDTDTVLKCADKMLKPAKQCDITNIFEPEPDGVVKAYVVLKFPVAVPLFHLGFKEKAEDYSLKKLAAFEVLLSMIGSSSGSLYKKLMDANLINSTFSYEFSQSDSYCLVVFSGESRNPKLASEKIREYIREIKQNGLDKEDFEIAKRSVYGDIVSSFNSVDNIASSIIDFVFSDREYYAYVDAAAELVFEDVEDCLKEVLNEESSVLSVILPMEESTED